jgi:CheY-like chemotaxis protein
MKALDREQAPAILLVEDNPADVALIREALSEIGSPVRLMVAKDGAEAIARVRKEGPYSQASCPDLILLDLNLPKISGHEVLEAIRGDHDLKWIPVIVLTTSEAESDIFRSYATGANCYITKPPDLDGFFAMVDAIHHFWLNVVELPSHRRDDPYPVDETA